MASTANGTRAIALVGPAGAGKTTLAEALLFASGTTNRQGSVDQGTSTGDSSPEARAREGSTELNLLRFDYLGDSFVLFDTPGAAGFVADGYAALASADMAVVVVDPDPERAALVGPTLRQLDRLGLPHAIFVNRIDQARGSVHDLLSALQPLSAEPLLARQLPISEDGHVVGFVDLALERAYRYVPGKPSEAIPIPVELQSEETGERFHMLETLADHDDTLLEQLLSDEVPDLKTVLNDLRLETQRNLVVPVLFGSALHDSGVRRLLKLLRHEAPSPSATAERLGFGAHGLHVFKITHGGAVGRLALARVHGDGLAEGSELETSDGRFRVGALFTVQGDKTTKVPKAGPGDVVAIAKADAARAGHVFDADPDILSSLIQLPVRNAAVAISTKDRKDDVKLSTALHKIVEEDPSLEWTQDDVSHETLLRGVNDEHLAVTLARLKRRYGVEVVTQPPRVAYRESIRQKAHQRGRHKKQSGGHGQYGDVVIEIRPLGRGEGFVFEDRITGGVVPRHWIPAVEDGIRDAMQRGPLGFPVVDVAVTLIDGSHHSVDSSEIAFRIAGRLAMSDALAQAAPYLLEPVHHITIHAPPGTGSKMGSAVSSRRGQILSMGAHPEWDRWEQIVAHIPEASLHGLDAELRSLSQGLASFEARLDHLSELAGKAADQVVKAHAELVDH